jgi:hypothetical protein
MGDGETRKNENSKRACENPGLELKHNKGGVSLDASPRTGVRGSQAPTYATHAGPKPNTTDADAPGDQPISAR